MSTLAPPASLHLYPRVTKLASTAGWLLVALAVGVLMGWALQVSVLVSRSAGLEKMMPNTAAGFLLAGLALIRRERRDGALYSLGVLAIGLATTIEYLAHSDLGIDQLLFRDPTTSIAPGRMSQVTSVGFVLLGPALAWVKVKSELGRRLSRALAGAVGMLGIIVLLGYSYDTQALYRMPPYHGMALHTAIAFVIAAVGVHCANPAEGMVRKIQGDGPGGVMLRRMLPVAALVPYLLGFVVWWVAHRHLGWGIGFLLGLLVVSLMVCLAVLMLWNAHHLDRGNMALQESEKRFRLMADSAPVLMWIAGVDKGCTDFNREWLRFTGRSLEQELGNGWAEGVHPGDLRRCLRHYADAFDARESFAMEYRLRRHDGQYRWVLDRAVPRTLADGSFAGYIGCCTDISDQKEAEATRLEFGERLIAAQEEERSRIARELHDDINQRLALLANELRLLKRPAREQLQKRHSQGLLELTEKIANDVRSLSHRLHPATLEYLGLEAAVRDLCREVSRQHRIPVKCMVRDVPSDLATGVSLNLFRIAQESLRNVVKHSQARHARVELTGESEIVRLTITDDGVGFDPTLPESRHGLGLTSMAERLRSVGGEFSIRSRPSEGTQVEVTAPATRRESLELALAG